MSRLILLKRTSMDFILNILASAVLTGTMQIIVYPLLAKWVSLAEYGTIVTAMGLINTVVGGLGTSLNNTRLIMNSEYGKKKLIGDFNFVLICASLISGMLLTLISSLYLGYQFSHSILVGLHQFLWCADSILWWIID